MPHDCGEIDKNRHLSRLRIIGWDAPSRLSSGKEFCGPFGYGVANLRPFWDVIPQAPKRPDMSLVTKKILFGLISLTLLLVLTVLFLPWLIPTDLVRRQVVASVKAATGRDLIIAGKASVSLFPSLGVRLEDVRLANPPEMTGPPLVTMAKLELRLGLFALLSGNYQVQRFVLIRPVVQLRRDEAGRVNWTFSPGSASTSRSKRFYGEPTPPTERTSYEGPQRVAREGKADRLDLQKARGLQPAHSRKGTWKLALPSDLVLKDVRIEDGTLTFSDLQTGTHQEVSGITLSVALPSLEDAFTAQGHVIWRKQRLDITAKLSEPIRLSRGKASALTLTLSHPQGKADFSGKLKASGEEMVSGKWRVDTEDLRDFLASFQVAPAIDVEGKLARFHAEALMGFRGSVLTIDQLSARLGNLRLTGQGKVEISGPQPRIVAKISGNRWDLRPYLPASSPTKQDVRQNGVRPDEGSLRDKGRSGGKVAGNKDPLTSLIETVNADNTLSPETPLAFLMGFDADIQLALAGLRLPRLALGQTDLAMRLQDGVLTLDLQNVDLYGGRGNGRVILSTKQSPPILKTRLDVFQLSAKPFLTDVAGVDWLSGKTRLSVSLTGQGTTWEQLAPSLGGQGRFQFRNGTLRGINLAKMMRALRKGQLTGWQQEGDQETDFSEFSASFALKDGVARTKDMRFAAPLLRIRGEGQVNLVKRSLDLRVKPKLVASLAGQGGQRDVSGVSFPVRVSGPWDNPSFLPDIAGIVQDPNVIAEGVKAFTRAVSPSLSRQKGETGQQNGGTSDETGIGFEQMIRQAIGSGG